MISIIVCCHNKYNFTRACVNDLLKLDLTKNEIIVVDNASTDDTQKELSQIKQIKYIRNEENVFHAKACNQGYRFASGDHVIFMNNDIRVKQAQGWTEALVQRCEDALAGPTMGQLNNKLDFVQEANVALPGYSYLSGWMIAATKTTWNKLDLGDSMIWNEKYPFYFDDTDLSFRAREAGIPIKVVSVPVVHFGKISAAQLNIQSLYTDARKIFVEEWKDLIQ
jgi:GT2 family glycosyltransferase